MNTTNQNITAPSVTIAPRNPARGVLTFVVTLTTFKDTRSYPCRSLESATKLVERFIAGVTKPRPAALPPKRPSPPKAQVTAPESTPPPKLGESFSKTMIKVVGLMHMGSFLNPRPRAIRLLLLLVDPDPGILHSRVECMLPRGSSLELQTAKLCTSVYVVRLRKHCTQTLQ